MVNDRRCSTQESFCRTESSRPVQGLFINLCIKPPPDLLQRGQEVGWGCWR